MDTVSYIGIAVIVIELIIILYLYNKNAIVVP